MAGRGFGKTRIGAEEAWYQGAHPAMPGRRLAVIAPTQSDLRKVLFEGESGLRARCPAEVLLGGTWEKAFNSGLGILKFANGSIMTGFSAEQPGRLRGPQHHWAWCDEMAAWEPARMQETWDMMQFGLRLGDDPRVLVTTTPKPYQLIYDLVKDPTTRVITGSTYDNKANLAAPFLKKILAYEGTDLGAQEIHASLVDLDSRAILKAHWWRRWAEHKADGSGLYPERPALAFLSLDGAYTEDEANDETAVTVWYVFIDMFGKTRILLRYAWKERLEFPDLIERLKSTIDNFRLKRILIEAKGPGLSIIQQIRRLRPEVMVHAQIPLGDKIARAHSVTPILAQGLVSGATKLVAGADRPEFIGPVADVIEQCRLFPFARHDDIPDSVTQALDFIRRQGFELFDADAPEPPPLSDRGIQTY